ncbi:Scr1 family TA system antitoxin-like transcriptional regulator [Streptomyces sp. G6]|uniref:Scr1 family TA system antitoxin-like transcriptional regulator n=1 Tax=Streptomyces sp. G6 TaxID=1178736 RepID=UPI003ED8CDF8
MAHRMQRQQVFSRGQPFSCLAYVHEAALRMPYGGRETARHQLEHLVERSEQPSTEVRAVPTYVDGFPGAGHALLYAHGAVPQLDTVQLDSAHGPEFTGAEAQLTKYRAHLGWMEDAALSASASRDLIRRVAREL